MNFHPDYGPPQPVRDEAVAIAELFGVAEAVKQTGWARSTIFKWKKDAKCPTGSKT